MSEPTRVQALEIARVAPPLDGKATPIRLDPVPFILRRPYETVNPFGVSVDQWRSVVARAPIVSLCIRTLTLEITATPWKVTGEDEEEVAYYQGVLESANGESFDLFIERLLADVLSVPFGGGVEPTYYRGDILAGIYHVDGGTLYPTYDERLPYIQVDPDQPMRRVFFTPDQLKRVMWAPLPDIRNYGWSKPPVMEVFGAVQALMRSDVFYDQFLANTPEAGILDLMDMDEKDAKEWVQSWQELMVGIDPLKIPVLYKHTEPAKFIPFARSPVEIALTDVVKRYAEIVVGAFGMNIGDLGLYERLNTYVGTSRSIALSKRQGLGSLMRKLANMINSCFPDGVKFEWDPLDEEDRLRKAQAMKVRADTLKVMATVDPGSGKPMFPLEVIRKQAILDGLIDSLRIDDVSVEQIAEMVKEQEGGETQPPTGEEAPQVPTEEEQAQQEPEQQRAAVHEFDEEAPYVQDFEAIIDGVFNKARKRIRRAPVETIVKNVIEASNASGS